MLPLSLDPLKTLFIIQLLVQAILIGVVVFLIIADKKRSVTTTALDELKSVIQETSKLSDNFRDQIQMKVDLVTKAMAELDDKIREARLVTEGLEKASVAAKTARNFTPADVVKLYKGGFDPVDISQITGIPVGEVQLMVKMNPEG